MIKKIARRLFRILIGKRNIYGKLGKHNHFAQGAIVYENAQIGNNNYIAPYAIINNCRIGNYCSIGPGCILGLGEHDLCAVSTYPKVNNGDGNMTLFDNDRVTHIENDVWLGANAVVKQGVCIATGAVVGAGAVVTKDVPPYAIVVGTPAKILRYRFSEEKIQKLLASKWFEEDLSEAKKSVKMLAEIQ